MLVMGSPDGKVAGALAAASRKGEKSRERGTVIRKVHWNAETVTGKDGRQVERSSVDHGFS